MVFPSENNKQGHDDGPNIADQLILSQIPPCSADDSRKGAHNGLKSSQNNDIFGPSSACSLLFFCFGPLIVRSSLFFLP